MPSSTQMCSDSTGSKHPGGHRRRYFHYSLRLLLVVVTLLGILMGRVAVRMREAEGQRRAVEAIRKAGGSVAYDWQVLGQKGPSQPHWLRKLFGEDYFANVVEVILDSSAATDATLDHFQYLTPNYASCISGGSRVGDGGSGRVRDCTHLVTLYLYDTEITDAGLENLEGMKDLEILYLTKTQVTDAGIDHLARLTNLEAVSVGCTHVTPEGIQRLQRALPRCHISR